MKTELKLPEGASFEFHGAIWIVAPLVSRALDVPRQSSVTIIKRLVTMHPDQIKKLRPNREIARSMRDEHYRGIVISHTTNTLGSPRVPRTPVWCIREEFLPVFVTELLTRRERRKRIPRKRPVSQTDTAARELEHEARHGWGRTEIDNMRADDVSLVHSGSEGYDGEFKSVWERRRERRQQSLKKRSSPVYTAKLRTGIRKLRRSLAGSRKKAERDARLNSIDKKLRELMLACGVPETQAYIKSAIVTSNIERRVFGYSTIER